LATATFGFGFDANAGDVVTAALYTALTGSTLMASVNPLTGAKKGAAADVLGAKCTVTQASAAITVDVFGYLV
jgi:hypothetical protein